MATVAQATVAGPSIRPLGSALGAEVTGVDLSRRVDDDTFARIHRAFLEHHFLVFRDQALTVEQQIAFSERFGPLEAFPEKDKQKDAATVYNVANVTADGKKLGSKDIQVIFLKVNARWHTDSSYRSVPSLASLLYCIEPLPDEAVGGETEYANMFAAHDALPEDLRRQLEPLHMVHYYEYGRRLYPELPPMTHHERVHVPPVCHPVIRVHPDRGGKRSLFFTENAGVRSAGCRSRKVRRCIASSSSTSPIPGSATSTAGARAIWGYGTIAVCCTGCASTTRTVIGACCGERRLPEPARSSGRSRGSSFLAASRQSPGG